MASPFRQPESPLSLTYPRSGKTRPHTKESDKEKSLKLDRRIRDDVSNLKIESEKSKSADKAREIIRLPAVERVAHDYTDPMFALAQIATSKALPESSRKFGEFRSQSQSDNKENERRLKSERSGDLPTAKEIAVNQIGAIAKAYTPGGAPYQAAAEYSQSGSAASAAFQGLLALLPTKTMVKSKGVNLNKYPGGRPTGRRLVNHEFATRLAEAELSETADAIREER